MEATFWLSYLKSKVITDTVLEKIQSSDSCLLSNSFSGRSEGRLLTNLVLSFHICKIGLVQQYAVEN